MSAPRRTSLCKRLQQEINSCGCARGMSEKTRVHESTFSASITSRRMSPDSQVIVLVPSGRSNCSVTTGAAGAFSFVAAANIAFDARRLACRAACLSPALRARQGRL